MHTSKHTSFKFGARPPASSKRLGFAILLIAAITVALPPAYSGPKSDAPKLPKPQEVCEIVRQADSYRPESPFLPIALFFGTDLGQAIGKALLKLSSAGLNKYAEGFEASYSARIVGNDFDQTYDGAKYTALTDKAKTAAEANRLKLEHSYVYRFRRYLVYSAAEKISKAEIEKSLGLALPEDCIEYTRVMGANEEATLSKVVAFELSFKVVHGGENAEAMRVIPIQVNYNAPAAKKLKVPFTKKDELKATIAISLREGHLPDSKNFNRQVSFGASVADLEGMKNDALKKYSSDWMPAFSGRSYSIEVKVLESSDAKKWIEKAAKQLGEWGEAKLDEIKD